MGQCSGADPPIKALQLARPATRNQNARDGKPLKTAHLTWSDDRTTFACADRGQVVVQTINDEKPRSLAPKEEKKEFSRDNAQDRARGFARLILGG